MKIAIFARKDQLITLKPLIGAYRQKQIDVSMYPYQDIVPDMTDLEEVSHFVDAVLFVAPGQRAPHTIVNGPAIQFSDQRVVPIGILMPRRTEHLEKFVAAAAHVQLRSADKPSCALLSQRHPRFIKLAERMHELLKRDDHAFPVFPWMADRTFREDMLGGLNGLGSAVYLGHGRPSGWVGYYGLRHHHLPPFINEPVGALLSLCCLTASRRRVGYSFAERVVLNGSTAACLAAVKPTLHTDNTRWAIRIVELMNAGVDRLSELIKEIMPMQSSAWHTYRIIGDPLAPLYAPQSGVEFAESIKIYA